MDLRGYISSLALLSSRSIARLLGIDVTIDHYERESISVITPHRRLERWITPPLGKILRRSTGEAAALFVRLLTASKVSLFHIDCRLFFFLPEVSTFPIQWVLRNYACGWRCGLLKRFCWWIQFLSQCSLHVRMLSVKWHSSHSVVISDTSKAPTNKVGSKLYATLFVNDRIRLLRSRQYFITLLFMAR